MTELTKGSQTVSGIFMDVAIAKVNMSDRFRKDYGDIDDLALSIQNKGLLHPIIIDDNYNLLAGGRRLKAMISIGWSRTPAIVRKAKSQIDSLEIELLENIMRKDMEWQERVNLVKKIDVLYTEKEDNWTDKDTAELLDRSTGSVSQSLKLADAMEYIPELANSKTEDEANKKLASLQESLAIKELERRREIRIKENTTDTKLEGILKKAEDSYIISDVFEGLAKLEDNDTYLRFIEVDPPYGIDLVNMKRKKVDNTEAETYKEIKKEDYVEFLNNLCKELNRVSTRDAHIVFWFGIQWYQEVYNALTNNGWNVDIIPALWTKTHGQTNDVDNKLGRAYEPFFYGKKKDAAYGIFNSGSRGRVYVFFFFWVY